MSTVTKKQNYAVMPERQFKIQFAAIYAENGKCVAKGKTRLVTGRSVNFRVVATSEESSEVMLQILGDDGIPMFEWNMDEISGYEVISVQPTPFNLKVLKND